MIRATFITKKVGEYVCDNCGIAFEIKGLLIHWHFCPNCGATIDSWQQIDE
jgi:predicted RNA-binding Zn-ribbon protein involved in translation (DUF1610 family)